MEAARKNTFRSALASAMRIVLSFSLVFASTLGVECVAFGASASVEQGSVVNICIYEVDAKAKDQRGPLVRDAAALAADPKAKQTYVPALEKKGDTKRFMAVATLEGADGQDTADISDLISWKSSDDKVASVSAEGMVTAHKASEKPVELSCTLKPEHANLLASQFASHYTDGTFELSFKLTIATPYVESVEILQNDGEKFTGNRTLELDPAAKSYAFRAAASVFDPASGKSKLYTCTKDTGLSEQTDGMVDDLIWSVTGTDKATVKDGVLELNGADSATVECSAVKGAPGQDAPTDRIKVNPTGSSAAYVKSVELLQADGSPFDGTRTLTLSDADLPYQFQARVTFVASDTSESVFTFDGSTWSLQQEEGGSDKADVPFTLAWTVTSPAAASISKAGLLAMDAQASATVRCSTTMGKDGALVDDSIAINPKTAETLGVYLEYTPVPEGQYAYISLSLVGIDPLEDGKHEVTYQTQWEESSDGGATWSATESGSSEQQTLSRPTAAPYLGRLYRAKVVILDDPDKRAHGTEATSSPVELTIGEDGLRVQLFCDYVPEGQQATLHTIVSGTDNSATLVYTWEEAAGPGAEWKKIDEGYLPTYTVLTERSRYLHRFRVWVTTSDGQSAVSNTQMLSAQTGIDPSANGENPNTAGDGDTLSDIADKTDGVTVNLGGKKTGTLKPAGKLSMSSNADDADLTIDSDVNEKVAEQKIERQEQVNATQPGARWNPVYPVNEKIDENDLTDNPAAWLAVPFCLAVLAAGALEKTIKFRNQKRPAG